MGLSDVRAQGWCGLAAQHVACTTIGEHIPRRQRKWSVPPKGVFSGGEDRCQNTEHWQSMLAAGCGHWARVINGSTMRSYPLTASSRAVMVASRWRLKGQSRVYAQAQRIVQTAHRKALNSRNRWPSPACLSEVMTTPPGACITWTSYKLGLLCFQGNLQAKS